LSIEGQGSPIQVNIPNLITMFRIFMVPLVVWLIIGEQMAAAFWVFLLAGLSDGIDGFIAKRFDQQTLLGAYLDPLADKALLVSIYVTLGLQLHIPNWLVIMVVSRDILIVSAVILSWMLDRAVTMRPLFVSKANTTGQIVLAGLVLVDVGFGLDLTVSRQMAVVAVAVLTVASAIAYLIGWLEHMAQYEVPPPRRRAAKPSARPKTEPPLPAREKSRP
jgi:cardiolipin synthase